MNTIQITTADGTVNYTESEVLRFIEKAREVDAVQEVLDQQQAEKVSNRHKVRDFFSEVEWQDGEYTFTKSDVNELLDSIGAIGLTTRYNANYTITGTFTIECEDADDAETIFTDNVSVDFYDGEIDVDQIDVHDIEIAE